jgi:DNA polymerase alpha subunit A
VDEPKTNEKLKVDVKYYLAQQIHPVVSRLCDPIEGTDAARIAECLGESPST